MKYKIVVDKTEHGLYAAYSPVVDVLQAKGENIGEALDNLRGLMLCYLHDPEVELDIVIESSDDVTLDFSSGSLRQPK